MLVQYLQEVFKLYRFAILLQLVVLIPYLLKARHFQQRAGQVICKLLDTMMHAASPAVPTAYFLCAFGLRARLRQIDISLTSNNVLNVGASCNIVCFDKTGTLTEAEVRKGLDK